ncbi:MAG: RecQ family ATP-dependent DNA helicase [Chitinophagaceae bacterium]|nr:RecQ family ATP-dependent DNA helicase [Chitinophagaceae bacterium]
MNIHEILKAHWGFDGFRPLQEDIIYSVLDGKDTLALLPTGGGKSICFQVPALAKEGLCLVVSPLIALMKDQVENLKRKGIPSLAIYSGMNFLEIKKTLQNAAYGNYKFLYVSPERLETNLFLEYLPALNINLVAVDEAHCISQWGYDFRPPYTRIAALREQLPGVPVLALTASATKPVQDDICDKLLFTKTQQRFQQSFERPNLSYSVFNVPSKQNKLLEILRNVKGTAIVYCKSRKHTTGVAGLLRMNNIGAGFYHAGLNNEERNTRQENWINNKTRVIVCTSAFGMGIDKPDVRVVVHYDVPDCLENYYQEAGRAGRDGKRAYAVLLYNHKELESLHEQVDTRFPKEEEIRQVYIAIMNHLQVPAGAGEGVAYDFDMAIFASAFKLNILTVTYAIKALEQEGIFSYNEVFFNPSTVVFTASKEELADFEIHHPELEPLVKGLLRSYEGIFDFPAVVYESKLAKFLQSDLEEVKMKLRKLNESGIIHYTPQKDTPQLFLLQNRMYTEHYRINNANYLKRRKSFEERVIAMTGYIRDTNGCRSRQIAAYFNDKKVKPCGICDNCINEKLIHVSTEEFNHISGYILQQAGSSPLPFKEVLAALTGFNKQKVWKVMDYLQAEKKIEVDKEGNISVNR